MSDMLAVTPAECRGLSWLPPTDCHFVGHRGLVPLHAGEMGQAAAAMPLALVRTGQPAKWQLAGVCGLSPDHNLFVSAAGQWLGHYRPVFLSTWPFEMLRLEDRDTAILLFDRDSGLLCEDGRGESFFDEAGQPSPALAAVIELLRQQEARKVATEKAIRALQAHKLLVPWPESIRQQAGLTIEGLHIVDEARLAALDDGAWLSLRRALPLVYGVNFAIQQVHLLARLARLQQGSAGSSSASFAYEDIFGEEDSLNFDNLNLDPKSTH